jgi:hypothetical protein
LAGWTVVCSVVVVVAGVAGCTVVSSVVVVVLEVWGWSEAQPESVPRTQVTRPDSKSIFMELILFAETRSACSFEQAVRVGFSSLDLVLRLIHVLAIDRHRGGGRLGRGGMRFVAGATGQGDKGERDNTGEDEIFNHGSVGGAAGAALMRARQLSAYGG